MMQNKCLNQLQKHAEKEKKLLVLDKTTSANFCCFFNNFLGNICAFAQKTDWIFIRNYKVKIEKNGFFGKVFKSVSNIVTFHSALKPDRKLKKVVKGH